MIQKRDSATACVTTSLANMPADALIGTRAEWINPFGFFVFLLACHSRSVIARSANDRRNVSSVIGSQVSGIDLDVPFIRRSTLGNFAPVESKRNF